MARQPRVIEEPTEPPAEPVVESITYTPGEGDPSVVKWGGHTFHANVAKELKGHADGSEREKLNLQLIEAARGNKHFMVGNERPKRMTPALPRTATEYRAYMVGWIKDGSVGHASDLIARFAKDRDLRLACEVGSDDLAYLRDLFMPRLYELSRQDELNDTQVASLWLTHGFNEMPW